VTAGWRKLHNEELHELNCSRYIIRAIKIKEVEMGGACITHGRDKECIKSLCENPEGNGPFGRYRHRFQDNVAMCLKETVREA
jgi:hypothetical protein